MAEIRNHGLMLALAGIFLLLVMTLAAYRVPAPLPSNASLSTFSGYRAKAALLRLTGNETPHPIGSAANAQVRETIVNRLSGLGYTTELQSGFVCNDGVCGSPVNIIATRGSSSGVKDAVLLAAHYDSVPAGPGASDDGASVAGVLEIARILAAMAPPPHPIVLLITDGEEAGLLGAELFVNAHPLSKQVRAAVNLDARGTTGPSLMFETGTANAWLMHLYGSAIARPMTNSLYYVVYKQLPNDTDFTVFKGAGYQGFNLAYIGHVGRYHTALDNVVNAESSSMQHQGDNGLAALLALANAPTLRPPVAESVFFDVFARLLVSWPSGLTLPAALLALALLLAETVVLLRRGALTGRELAWGWVGTLMTLALGAALSTGLLALLIAVGKVPRLDGGSWIAHPLPMSAGCAAIALLAAGVAAAGLVRRAGFWGLWTAAAQLAAVWSLAASVLMPGASYVLLLTSLAAGVGAVPYTLRVMRSPMPLGWRSDIAAVLPALVIFLLILPLLRFLYMGLGSVAWPLSTVLLCLGTATLLPLLAAAGRRVRGRVIAMCALIAVCGLAATLYLPTYTADWPEHINVEYWSDADTGQSHYLALCDSLRLPPALAAAAHFDAVPRPRFLGSSTQGFYAAAPRSELLAPELTATRQDQAATTPPGSSTHFRMHLASARGAPEALVVFPASAHIADVAVTTAAGPARAKLAVLGGGATLLDIVGLPAAGVDFGVDVQGPLPLAVQVFDESYEFPDGPLRQRARAIKNAAGSQDGDVTVVHRTVSLDPAPGR